MEELVSPLNTALIESVLRQIHKVNYMIDFCNFHSEDSMARQYERQREGFLEELNELLSDFRINANLNVLASA